MIGRASLKGTVRLKIAFLDWVKVVAWNKFYPSLNPVFFGLNAFNKFYNLAPLYIPFTHE